MFFTKLLTKILTVTIIFMIIMIGVQPAFAAPVKVQVPFKGTIQGIESHVISFPTMDLDASGSGNATLLGEFTFHYTGVVDLLTATSTNLSMDLVAANGDVLYAEGYGQANPTGNISYVTEWYTITGGTGRFAGASGSFTLERQVNKTTNVTEGNFYGTIKLMAEP